LKEGTKAKRQKGKKAKRHKGREAERQKVKVKRFRGMGEVGRKRRKRL